MPVSVARWVRLQAAVFLLSSTGAAEPPAAAVGDATWGLPGIHRVGVPAMGAARLAAAVSAGYGYTEPLSPADREDHRISGALALGVAPIPDLELALRLDGRYDHHSDDHGHYADTAGDPRLLVRYGRRIGHDVVTGVEVDGWFPGKNAPSLELDATTFDAKWLAAWAPKRGPIIAALAGFRWDNSRHAAPDLGRLRPGDRFALGLSDYDAVLAGVGASFPIGSTELLAEATADFLVGSGAPPVSESPIRIAAGARHALSSAFAAQIVAEVSPSARPNVGPAAPLVPIEQRFSVLVGLSYRLPFARPEPEPAPSLPPESIAAPLAPPPARAVATSVSVRVTAAGSPIEGALVEVHVGGTSLTAVAAEKGTYRVDAVPPGAATVNVSADGYQSSEKQVHLDVGNAAPVDVELTAAPPSGEIRGLIRSFGGRGLSASIRVEPLGVETKTDHEGAFTVSVPPGDYEVVVHADRFKEQRRKIHVDENGVTILNAELFEAKQ